MKSVRITLIALGSLGMLYAAAGALTDRDVKGGALIFLIGVLVAHDGLFLPVVIGLGVLIGRLTPLRWRFFLCAALIASLAVTFVALPLVLGRGRAADNPSLLPLHYGRGLLEVYAVIWLAAAVATAMRAWTHRRCRNSREIKGVRAGGGRR